MTAPHTHSIRTAWSSLGWGGRIAVGLILVSVSVGLVLGFEIRSMARHHLIDSRSDALRTVSQAVVDERLFPTTSHDGGDFDEFDEAIRTGVLGGDTIGVKVWSTTGQILYATDPSLIGTRPSALPEPLVGSNRTESVVVVEADAGSHPELGDFPTLEYFFRITDADGVLGVFEVEQDASSLNESVSDIARTVWISIGIGIGLLTFVVASTVLAGARAEARRRAHVEALLGQALSAREDERRRIVASLHGDVGQRLYRVLYGLEGVSRKLNTAEGRSAAEVELGRLMDLVHGIDRSLRSELRLLHRDAVNEIGFTAALEDLAETTRVETGIDVVVDREYDVEPPRGVAGVLLWAIEEGVINARKHADASTITIRATRLPERFEVAVIDDGTGSRGQRGVGLATVEDRLATAGGGMTVRAARGVGTTLAAWVPVSGVPA